MFAIVFYWWNLLDDFVNMKVLTEKFLFDVRGNKLFEMRLWVVERKLKATQKL